MASILVLYENYADEDGVTLSGGSWALPLSNFVDPRPSKKARSSSASMADTKFRVDLGQNRTVIALAVTHTNLSADALYRVTRYSDAYVTVAEITDWLAIPGYPDIDPDGIGAAIFHVFSAEKTARYWQIEFDDTANTDGYIELGRCFLPNYWQPSLNFGTNNQDGTEANTPRQNSLGNVGYFNRRKPSRFMNFNFERLPSSDIAKVRRLRKVCNVDKQVVIIPDPDDTDNLNDTCFVATLKDIPAITLLDIGDMSTSFQAIEAIG